MMERPPKLYYGYLNILNIQEQVSKLFGNKSIMLPSNLTSYNSDNNSDNYWVFGNKPVMYPPPLNNNNSGNNYDKYTIVLR